MQINTLNADGWTVVDANCRFVDNRSGKRSAAEVAVLLLHNGEDVELEVIWTRETPDVEAGFKIARRWLRTDSDGGKWSIEYGYEGRWWVLFGPDGSPWGDLLDSTIAGSLIEATAYAARCGERGPAS